VLHISSGIAQIGELSRRAAQEPAASLSC